MQLNNRQSHEFSCNSRIIVRVTVKLHSTSPRAISYLTVTGTIILELHSNVCDYLAILIAFLVQSYQWKDCSIHE